MDAYDIYLALEADWSTLYPPTEHRALKVTSAVLSQTSRQRTVEVEIARPERAIWTPPLPLRHAHGSVG